MLTMPLQPLLFDQRKTGVLAAESTPDWTAIQFGNYLHWLVRQLTVEYAVSDQIEMDVRTSDMMVRIDDGISLALIANELVVNAIEHAFPNGASGTIDISLTYARVPADEAGAIRYGELEVTDSGNPFPSSMLDAGGSTSFTLIRMLTSQLHGNIALENCAQGKTFRLKFHLNDRK